MSKGFEPKETHTVMKQFNPKSAYQVCVCISFSLSPLPPASSLSQMQLHGFSFSSLFGPPFKVMLAKTKTQRYKNACTIKEERQKLSGIKNKGCVLIMVTAYKRKLVNRREDID